MLTWPLDVTTNIRKIYDIQCHIEQEYLSY